MAMRPTGATAQDIEDLYNWGTMVALSDVELLSLFVSSQGPSEAAFRALIHRHGPMVLGVCRRILGNKDAAEDAFQATFLVLVKKARTLRNRGLLTNWLYGVALRVSKRERTRAMRHRALELRAAEQVSEPASGFDRFDLRSVIDEEIYRLPEHYRQPLLLCHVEGLRHEDAALRLGCPVGTIESRLSRARDLLRSRLTRRGLAPSELAAGAVVRPVDWPSPCQLPPAVVEATVRAATEVAYGRSGAGPLLASLAACVSQAAFGGRSVTAALLLACCTMLALGLTWHRPPKSPPPAPSRIPSADAVVLSGISIDGRLDDWPAELRHYPINRQLLGRSDYQGEPMRVKSDMDAYFMAGYSERDQTILLAVVVRDDEIKVHPNIRRLPGDRESETVYATDAVEVYLTASLSDRRIPPPDHGFGALDATAMPVLQYVGVPGPVAAYGDVAGANPALMYRTSNEPYARMAYRREGDVTTYEWSIPMYEHFPDRMPRLMPGMRLGFDVAVVDKDIDQTPPVFMTWGSAPEGFKGLDAGSLGELILAEGP